MVLPRDLLTGRYTKPRLFLCEVDKERICQLETTNTNGTFKFNSYSELSFEVGRTYNDLITGEAKVNPYYDRIEAVRLIELENIGYFEIQGPELNGDGIKETKEITAYSLEYTLSQKYLTDFIINTGEIGSVEVTYAEDVTGDINKIKPVTLYNPSNPALSLLHLALQPIYGWKIGHVDASLKTLSRQFEIDRESVYDFLMNDVCEKFNCYIVFDTIDNTINVYAESLTSKFIGDGKTNMFAISPPFAQVNTVSVDGYKTTKWQYNSSTGVITLEDTPDAGSHIEVVDGSLAEWETDVFISFDNLSQEIKVSYDADSIKTRLTVTYGDDGDIREVNLGVPYLTDISYFYTVDWMGQDLYDAYTKYMQKSNSLQLDYTNNSQEIWKLNDQISYEENRLSLEYSLVASVHSETVGTYYTKHKNADGSFYYREVSLPTEYQAGVSYYSNATTNVTEEKLDNLLTVLKKYFRDENTDGDDGKITSWKTDYNKLSSEFKFIESNFNNLCEVLSSVNTNRTRDENVKGAISEFLDLIWSELGRTPLKTMYLAPYQSRKDVNITDGWANVSNANYSNYYPLQLYIESIEAAIANLDVIIKGLEENREKVYEKNSYISDQLTMDNNFTEKQLIRLSAFMREDELRLDDIVETSQDDLSGSFKVKQDAMESGRIELQKICQPQLQFFMSMANIYALPEFAPIVHQFQLGNVIKVALRPDYVKQSRLMQVDINFDDFSDFSCEFGELTNLRTQSDIHADLLKNAISAGKSVATNSGHWSHGSDIATEIDLRIQQGLLDATTKIKAMDGSQGVEINKNGIWLKKINEDGSTDDKQTRLVNNMILMSDDGFKTSRAAIGELNERYGLIADIVQAGLIEGSEIVGGTIQIGKQPDGSYAFEVHSDGTVRMGAGNTIEGYISQTDLNQTLQELNSIIMDSDAPIIVQEGTLWLDTSKSSDDEYTLMIYSNNSWEQYDLSDRTIHYDKDIPENLNEPQDPALGDLWITKNSGLLEKVFEAVENGSGDLEWKELPAAVGDTQPSLLNIGQLWQDTSVIPNRLMVLTSDNTDGDTALSWQLLDQQSGNKIYTSEPQDYKQGDVWILNEQKTIGDIVYEVGAVLRADSDLNWVDAMSDVTSVVTNIKQHFEFDTANGLTIKQPVVTSGTDDTEFYVNINAQKMGFHSVGKDENDMVQDVEVVSIGNNSSKIKNATFEGADGTVFENSATFNSNINIHKPNDDKYGFICMIEENGSFSFTIRLDSDTKIETSDIEE